MKIVAVPLRNGVPIPFPKELLLQAERLYPHDAYSQMKWLKAIEFLRTTKRGWILDRAKWKPTRLI